MKYKFHFETIQGAFWKLPVTRPSSDNKRLALPSFSTKQMSVAAISSLLCRTNARQADIWEEL